MKLPVGNTEMVSPSDPDLVVFFQRIPFIIILSVIQFITQPQNQQYQHTERGSMIWVGKHG